jgi:hypothetical protein
MAATDRTRRALFVINAELHPIAVAEIEFRQVAVKVLLAAMLVDSDHAFLEE